MPHRKSLSPTIFLYENHQFRRIKFTRGTEITVGIWWHAGLQCIAFLQPVSEIQVQGTLIDSELSHDGCWQLARDAFSDLTTSEYFEIPRGRVIWNRLTRAGIIYHGNATPKTMLHELAKIYRLPRWECHLDEHYLTGKALEEFYRSD